MDEVARAGPFENGRGCLWPRAIIGSAALRRAADQPDEINQRTGGSEKLARATFANQLISDQAQEHLQALYRMTTSEDCPTPIAAASAAAAVAVGSASLR